MRATTRVPPATSALRLLRDTASTATCSRSTRSAYQSWVSTRAQRLPTSGSRSPSTHSHAAPSSPSTTVDATAPARPPIFLHLSLSVTYRARTRDRVTPLTRERRAVDRGGPVIFVESYDVPRDAILVAESVWWARAPRGSRSLGARRERCLGGRARKRRVRAGVRGAEALPGEAISASPTTSSVTPSTSLCSRCSARTRATCAACRTCPSRSSQLPRRDLRSALYRPHAAGV